MAELSDEMLIAIICGGFLVSLLSIVVMARIERHRLKEFSQKRHADKTTLNRCLAAFVLSIVLAGIGQFYNRQFFKGLAFMACTFFAWFFLLGWVIHFMAIVDAVYVSYLLRDSPWKKLPVS